MSNAYPRRRYTPGPRKPAQITDADLAAHGLPRAPQVKPAAPALARPKAAAPAINPRLWKTIELVIDQHTGTRKSTRILALPGGVLVNTCTRGSAGMSEALVFVAGATAADFPA